MTPLQRLEVGKVTGHESVRGRGGVIAVLYKTHWVGLSEPSWEREVDLQLSRTHILLRCYWAGTPDQRRQTNRLCRRMRIGAAQSELSRNNGERFLAPGYACAPRAEWLRRYEATRSQSKVVVHVPTCAVTNRRPLLSHCRDCRLASSRGCVTVRSHLTYDCRPFIQV